jgi:hypothetical protein
MKNFGCAAAVIGTILCIAGLALYVMAGVGAINARPVASIALPVGRAVRSDFIKVDTKRLCSISVTANLRTKYPAVSFPLRYSVFDASGEVLSSGQTVFGRRDRAVWTSRTMMGGSLGLYHHEYGYETFAVKPPGRIRIEAQLDPDTQTRPSRVEDITLIVYDNVSDHRRPVFAGTVLSCGGAVIGGLGIVMFVAGVARNRSATAR